MEMEQRKSGIVVPKEKPPLPKRQYGLLEVQDEESRAKTRVALNLLWDALELGSVSTGINTIAKSAGQAHLKTYDFFAEMLLGEDRPDHEVLT